jgi:hypothetical protein
LKTGPHLDDATVVAVLVQDANLVVKGGFGDKEVGQRRSVPHAAVVAWAARTRSSSSSSVVLLTDMRT